MRFRKSSNRIWSIYCVLFWMFFGVGRLCSFRRKITCSALHLSSLPKRHFSELSKLRLMKEKNYQSHIEAMNSSKDEKVRARLVTLNDLEECGERLRKGDLVSFPTETVYGLGCNALDPAAIIKVFEAKERPLTDPLISHVTDPQVAFDLWNANETSLEGKMLRLLSKDFWPGPLTLVARAAPHVPDLLMANTGFVACRAPQHPISISLINAAQVPIAAPSANKFGHVSPTRAQHVWDDLKYEDVWIVGTNDCDEQSEDVCAVGVESSVAKIEMDSESAGCITLLRQGAICIGDIQKSIANAGLTDFFRVESSTKKATDETVANVAPGQTIRHYSPDIPSFMLSRNFQKKYSSLDEAELATLSQTVIIDFRGKLSMWKDGCVAYRELSESGDSLQATNTLFDTLRWAERVQGAVQIIFPEIVESEPGKQDALVLALKDRLTRAASGVIIEHI